MNKQWAIGLTDEEFAKEFARRFPYAKGILPDKEKWLKKEEKKSTGIDPIKEKDVIKESFPDKTKPVEDDGMIGATCPGCNKEFRKESMQKLTVAMSAHKRHCKELLKEKDG